MVAVAKREVKQLLIEWMDEKVRNGKPMCVAAEETLELIKVNRLTDEFLDEFALDAIKKAFDRHNRNLFKQATRPNDDDDDEIPFYLEDDFKPVNKVVACESSGLSVVESKSTPRVRNYDSLNDKKRDIFNILIPLGDGTRKPIGNMTRPELKRRVDFLDKHEMGVRAEKEATAELVGKMQNDSDALYRQVSTDEFLEIWYRTRK